MQTAPCFSAEVIKRAPFTGAKIHHLLFISGDDARTLLWQLDNGALFQEICRPFHGASIASVWAEIPNDLKMFIIGCSDGTLQLYRQILPDFKVSNSLLDLDQSSRISSRSTGSLPCLLHTMAP
jgi:hypothetical protein